MKKTVAKHLKNIHICSQCIPHLDILRSVYFRYFNSGVGSRWPSADNLTGISDREIANLANKPLHNIRLADLVRHGRPPLSKDNLVTSANHTLSIIPVSLAHVIKALWHLPYMIVANPNISKIFDDHLNSLCTLLSKKYQYITTLNEHKFTSALEYLIEAHSRNIPFLAQGFLECQKYMCSNDVDKFLNDHLRVRIGMRLVAEQHIALHYSSQSKQKFSPSDQHRLPSPSYIGVLDTELKPFSVIQSCASFVSEICELKYGLRPSYVINGDISVSISYVPLHLEYIITELLKNAFRATIENSMCQEPVIITIAAVPYFHRKNLFRHHINSKIAAEDINSRNDLSDKLTSGLTIRIRDRGGGISPKAFPYIWSYSFTTFSDDSSKIRDVNSANFFQKNFDFITGSSSIAGLGYGLPLARAYAEYFNGSIALQNLHGWGCDAYLRIRGLS